MRAARKSTGVSGLFIATGGNMFGKEKRGGFGLALSQRPPSVVSAMWAIDKTRPESTASGLLADCFNRIRGQATVITIGGPVAAGGFDARKGVAGDFVVSVDHLRLSVPSGMIAFGKNINKAAALHDQENKSAAVKIYVDGGAGF